MLTISAITISLLGLALQPDASNGWWDEKVETSIARAGDRVGAWRAMLEATPESQRRGMAFLVSHMPAADVRSLAPSRIRENVALAYEARATAPWSDRMSEDVFFDFVLPYANVSEARDPWRREFRERFLPLVKDCKTAGEAAQRLNEGVFSDVGVRYSTKRRRADQSPKESMEIGMASCTGLSIILANACRAVGVPARLAGIANWPNKRGNHTWVEIWDDGEWHFTGACEPNPQGLDRTWFQGDAALATPGSKRHGIWAVSWRATGDTFPMVWDRSRQQANALDVTQRYLPQQKADPKLSRLMVAAFDSATGQRLAVPVTLSGDSEATGMTKDESADTNDYLTFDLQKGQTVTIQLDDGADTRITHTASGEQSIVRASVRDDRELRARLDAWFAASAKARGSFRFTQAEQERLAADPAQVRAVAWAAYRAAPIHDAARGDYEVNRVMTPSRTSMYTVKNVGQRPKDGWPLFIAMHGGGGAPKRVNDSQWRIMQRYYRDQSSVTGYRYLALRAPNDTWNGFYDTAIAPMIEQLIRNFVLFGDVDPNKVFIMGYSHGGYGAFGIGPKIPDRFAAVHSSAAAPTPGITAAENLRNTRFTYMIGEKDTAYGRAERCRAFAKAIAALQKTHGEDAYPVVMEFIDGQGHGGLPDRDKIADMYGHRRSARPKAVSWVPTGPEVRHFNWLAMNSPSGRIEARIDGNEVRIDATDVTDLSLHLDERDLDVTKPVLVRVGGEKREFRLRPNLTTLCESLMLRGDPDLAWTTSIQVATSE